MKVSQPGATKARHGFGLAPVFLSLLLPLSGCAKLDLGESFTLWKSDPKPQTPDSLAAVWTETTLQRAQLRYPVWDLSPYRQAINEKR